MTTRRQVEDAIRRYAQTPRMRLPRWLREPNSEHEFALAMAVIFAGTPSVVPVYDENDRLVAWNGIALATKDRQHMRQ